MQLGGVAASFSISLTVRGFRREIVIECHVPLSKKTAFIARKVLIYQYLLSISRHLCNIASRIFWSNPHLRDQTIGANLTQLIELPSAVAPLHTDDENRAANGMEEAWFCGPSFDPSPKRRRCRRKVGWLHRLQP